MGWTVICACSRVTPAFQVPTLRQYEYTLLTGLYQD